MFPEEDGKLRACAVCCSRSLRRNTLKMKNVRWWAGSVLVWASVIFFTSSARAQIGVIIAGSDGLFSDQTNSGLPYTAEYKTTTVRKLANGATITRTEKSLFARDSHGRMYSEQTFGFYQSERDKMVTVFDPVARIILSWESLNKEVHVSHLPPAEEIRAQAEKIRDLAKAAKEAQTAAGSSSSKPVTRIVESLSSATPAEEKADGTEEMPVPGREESIGSKTINGIVAEGTRTTSTIPKGAMGNDQPLVSTHEVWISSELKLNVLEIDDDPNNGTTTKELVKLDRSEPDPALFQAPEGYTVKDQGVPKGFPGSETEPKQ